jgi:hypothetical protein
MGEISGTQGGEYEDIFALMMEAVRTSETSVYFNGSAWRYIPEGCLSYYLSHSMLYKSVI